MLGCPLLRRPLGGGLASQTKFLAHAEQGHSPGPHGDVLAPRTIPSTPTTSFRWCGTTVADTLDTSRLAKASDLTRNFCPKKNHFSDVPLFMFIGVSRCLWPHAVFPAISLTFFGILESGPGNQFLRPAFSAKKNLPTPPQAFPYFQGTPISIQGFDSAHKGVSLRGCCGGWWGGWSYLC